MAGSTDKDRNKKVVTITDKLNSSYERVKDRLSDDEKEIVRDFINNISPELFGFNEKLDHDNPIVKDGLEAISKIMERDDRADAFLLSTIKKFSKSEDLKKGNVLRQGVTQQDITVYYDELDSDPLIKAPPRKDRLSMDDVGKILKYVTTYYNNPESLMLSEKPVEKVNEKVSKLPTTPRIIPKIENKTTNTVGGTSGSLSAVQPSQNFDLGGDLAAIGLDIIGTPVSLLTGKSLSQDILGLDTHSDKLSNFLKEKSKIQGMVAPYAVGLGVGIATGNPMLGMQAMGATKGLQQIATQIVDDETGENKYDVGGIMNSAPPMLDYVEGKRHEEGGVGIGPNELEGGETILDGRYVFSDRITNPDTGRTFAEDSKRIDKKYSKYGENDMLANMSKREELQKLFALQEEYKKKLEEDLNSDEGETFLAKGGWMQKVSKSIERRGTKGVFREQARRHGFKSTLAFANYVLSHPNKFSALTRKRAALAKTFITSRKKEDGGDIFDDFDIDNIPEENNFLAKGGWMQKVKKEIKRRGTEGVFREQARRHGFKSTLAFANYVLSHPNKFDAKTRRRAALAKAFITSRKKQLGGYVLPSINPNDVPEDYTLYEEPEFITLEPDVEELNNLVPLDESGSVLLDTLGTKIQKELDNELRQDNIPVVRRKFTSLSGGRDILSRMSPAPTLPTQTIPNETPQFDVLNSTSPVPSINLSSLSDIEKNNKANYANEWVGAALASIPALYNIGRGIFGKVQKTQFPRVEAPTVDLSRTRDIIERKGDEAQAILAQNLRNIGASQGEYLSNLAPATAKIAQDTQDRINALMEKEKNINAEAKYRADLANLRTKMTEELFNTQAEARKQDFLTTGLSQLSQIGQGVLKDIHAEKVQRRVNKQQLDVLKDIFPNIQFKTNDDGTFEIIKFF